MASTELRAAAQQVLEALEGGADSWQLVGPAIDALKAALAELVRGTAEDRAAFEAWLNPGGFAGNVSPWVEPGRYEKNTDQLAWLAWRACERRRKAALAEPETCTWQQDGDSDSGVYGTSCGHYFSIDDGTPEDNKMAWCCYCGKKLAQALITEDSDE